MPAEWVPDLPGTQCSGDLFVWIGGVPLEHLS